MKRYRVWCKAILLFWPKAVFERLNLWGKKMWLLSWLVIKKIRQKFPLNSLSSFEIHFYSSLAALQDLKEARNEQSADLTLEVAKEIRSQKFPALFAATNMHCLGWNFLETVGSLTVAATACVLSYNCRFLFSNVRENI